MDKIGRLCLFTVVLAVLLMPLAGSQTGSSETAEIENGKAVFSYSQGVLKVNVDVNAHPNAKVSLKSSGRTSTGLSVLKLSVDNPDGVTTQVIQSHSVSSSVRTGRNSEVVMNYYRDRSTDNPQLQQKVTVKVRNGSVDEVETESVEPVEDENNSEENESDGDFDGRNSLSEMSKKELIAEVKRLRKRLRTIRRLASSIQSMASVSVQDSSPDSRTPPGLRKEKTPDQRGRSGDLQGNKSKKKPPGGPPGFLKGLGNLFG